MLDGGGRAGEVARSMLRGACQGEHSKGSGKLHVKHLCIRVLWPSQEVGGLCLRVRKDEECITTRERTCIVKLNARKSGRRLKMTDR